MYVILKIQMIQIYLPLKRKEIKFFPQNKILPALLQKHQFVSIENYYQLPSTSKQIIKNVSCNNTFFDTVNKNDKYTYIKYNIYLHNIRY